MKHAQEVEGWALDEGNRITQTMSLNEATYVTVAKGLQRQHARSVRIVKREIKRLTASIKDDKRGKNDDAAAIHVYALSICNTLLGKLQRGRGGKG